MNTFRLLSYFTVFSSVIENPKRHFPVFNSQVVELIPTLKVAFIGHHEFHCICIAY